MTYAVVAAKFSTLRASVNNTKHSEKITVKAAIKQRRRRRLETR